MNWSEEFDGSITVCDRKGIVVYMNNAAKRQFAKYNEGGLIGMSLIDCHPEPSRTLLLKMLEEPMYNSYTTEKNGTKTMIHQSPWFENDEFKGVIEISFKIPLELPNHKR